MHRATDIKVRLDSSVSDSTWTFANDWPSPSKILWCDPLRLRAKLSSAGRIEREWDDPLDALDWIAGTITDHPASDARWIGYLSYDLGRLIEPYSARTTDDVGLPLFCFTLHAAGETHPPVPAPIDPVRSDLPLRSNFTRRAYEAAVARAIEYIRAGRYFSGESFPAIHRRLERLAAIRLRPAARIIARSIRRVSELRRLRADQ